MLEAYNQPKQFDISPASMPFTSIIRIIVRRKQITQDSRRLKLRFRSKVAIY